MQLVTPKAVYITIEQNITLLDISPSQFPDEESI